MLKNVIIRNKNPKQKNAIKTDIIPIKKKD